MVDIAIGQFYPVKSKIHSLDSRLKLISTFVILTLLFFVENFWGYFLVFDFLAFVIYASKVPIGFIVKGLRGILAILMFTVVLNAFLTPGEHVLFKFYFITLTLEGLLLALKVSMRLVLLVVTSSLLTLTTSPIDLTSAIEFLLAPFKKIGVPAHEIAMMMTIALRFIPTLLEEMDKIMKAQIARGADFDTGGIVKKAKALIPLLVPLFVSAFRRADELAMAMESRCYRGDIGRTSLKQFKLTKDDKFAGLILFIFFLVVMGINML